MANLEKKDWRLLFERIETGECTPFLGAGASCKPLPLGSEIARRWAKEFGYPLKETDDLAKVAQFVAVEYDAIYPKKRIQTEFRDFKKTDFSGPDDPHGVLADLPLPIYITTNYDNFMADALLSRNKKPRVEVCRWNMSLKQKLPPSVFKSGDPPSDKSPVVFHLHGHIDYPESMVLTEDDYLDFLKNISEDLGIIPPRIQEAFTDSSLLFMGYSIADWDFRIIFRRLLSYLEISLARAHVSVQLEPDVENAADQTQKAQEYLNSYFNSLYKIKMNIYWGNCRGFATDLSKLWREYKCR